MVQTVAPVRQVDQLKTAEERAAERETVNKHQAIWNAELVRLETERLRLVLLDPVPPFA